MYGKKKNLLLHFLFDIQNAECWKPGLLAMFTVADSANMATGWFSQQLCVSYSSCLWFTCLSVTRWHQTKVFLRKKNHTNLLCVHTYVHTQTCIYVCMYVLNTCMFLCMCVYIILLWQRGRAGRLGPQKCKNSLKTKLFRWHRRVWWKENKQVKVNKTPSWPKNTYCTVLYALKNYKAHWHWIVDF